jgi:cell division septation protein DedD
MDEPAPTPAERQVTITTEPAANRASATATRETERQPLTRTTNARTFVPANEDHPLVTSGKFADGVYKIEIREAGPGAYGVQVASFSDLSSAMQEVSKLQAKWFDNILVRKTDTAYKVILGPFDDQKSATAYNKDLKSRYKISGFTVSLE